MIGIVVVTHGPLAQDLVDVTQGIVGPQERLLGVGLAPDEDVEKARTRIRTAIEQVEAGSGVVILTDMFGGTPSNLALSFLAPGKTEILTGVNLPMMLKIASLRMSGEEGTVASLAATLLEHARKNVQSVAALVRK